MNKVNKISILMLFIFLLSACNKPIENIQLMVDTDILKHTALVRVSDGSNGGAAPANATITVLGEAASDVYEISGKKDIKLVAGFVTIGLDPSVEIEGTEQVKVNVQISAPGFRTEVREVVFSNSAMQQIVRIPLTKVGSTAPPVVLPPPPVYDADISINFTGKCANRGDVAIRPSVYVSFRESGVGAVYRYLGYMEKGNIVSNLVLMGKTYDFQIVFGGQAHEVTQKIEQLSYDLTINMGNACNFL